MAKQKESSGRLKWLLAAFCFMALFFAAASCLNLNQAVGVYAGTNTAVYTITSTSAVSVSGKYPSGSSAAYSSTYDTRYQLTEGKSMTLTLSGYDGATITGLTLSMKSNTSKGGGSFSMMIGGVSVSSIADSKFNTANWNGGWSTSYVDISPTVTSTEVGTGENIIITISATESSLYCQSFTLSYSGQGSSAAASYYSYWVSQSKLAGKSGSALADDIHYIMWKSLSTRVSYDSLKTNLRTTDVDPTDEDYVIDFWTGTPMLGAWENGVWNREHVWPAALSNGAWSRGTPDKSEKYAGCDVHHIRPSVASLNISRGAGAIGIVDKSQEHTAVTVNGITSSCLDGKNSAGNSVFEPGDNRKGDLARIFFYLYVTYSTRIDIGGVESALSDCTSADTNYSTYVADLTDIIVDGSSLIDVGSDYSSPIEMLLAWNELDPVDALESQRNEGAYRLQGNRNPFIDFPDIAKYIFDSGSFYDLSLDADQTVLYGDDYAPTVRTMPASYVPSVTYTSSNTSVISVSNGKEFSVHAPGITRITASVTISGISFSKVSTVQVVTEITSISLSVSSYTITKGKTFDPQAYAVPANAYNRKITWSSSNSAIATVNATTGKIKGVSAGNCTITATADANDSITATLALTVVNATDGLLDIELSDFPSAAAAYDDYTWTSGDYSGTGRIYKKDCMQLAEKGGSYVYNSTAFTKGIAQIILYSSGTSSTADADFAFRVGNSTITSSSGGTEAGTVTVPPYGGIATWTNTTGNTYTHFFFSTVGEKAKYLSRIRIVFGEPTPVLESLSLDYSEMNRSYYTGESLDLSGLAVSAVYDDGSSKTVTGICTYSPANGATLNSGHNAVTVSYSDGITSVEAHFPISVAGNRTLSSVSVAPESATIYARESVQLFLTATYDDGSTSVIGSGATWSSSATGVATTASSGLVTGVVAGEATITASYTYIDGISRSDSSTITVLANQFALSQDTFTCTFGDYVFEPSFTATYGGSDVTASCSISESFTDCGSYVYFKTLGVHEFTVSYTTGGHTFKNTITITTTNVGAANADIEHPMFELVDDESDLVPTKQYIFASASRLTGSTSVLGAQGSNVRSCASFNHACTGFQLLTLGTSSKGWTLSTGTKYLYASSSSNNYIGEKATLDDNGNWSIDIDDETCEATIVAQGTNTRNQLRYNYNGGNPRFTCYKSDTDMDKAYIFKCLDNANSQANALKDYLDDFRTCDATSETVVKRLALEYNTLNCSVGSTTAKQAFASLLTSAQFTYGTDYRNGSYITDDPSGDAVSCLTKLRYIVGRWNSAHGNDLVCLYTDSYYNGTDNGGSGTKETPYAANPIAIKQQQSSPLTATLSIVLGSGSAGIGLILGAYLVSKKKKKYRA